MHLLMTEYRLRFGRSLSPGEATQLRGFFAASFVEEERIHHHRANGSLVYDYPRVQFKVIERTAFLVGFADGADIVERLWRETDAARIGNDVLPVLEGTILRSQAEIGESDEPLRYRFINPWLGLNQENYRRYDRAATDAEREAVLNRVVIGNCLSLAKGFGHRVMARLQADTRRLRPRTCRFKGLPMIGFDGSFTINFHLPDHIGVGKSVSRGFGTVEVAADRLPVGRTRCSSRT